MGKTYIGKAKARFRKGLESYYDTDERFKQHNAKSFKSAKKSKYKKWDNDENE